MIRRGKSYKLLSYDGIIFTESEFAAKAHFLLLSSVSEFFLLSAFTTSAYVFMLTYVFLLTSRALCSIVVASSGRFLFPSSTEVTVIISSKFCEPSNFSLVAAAYEHDRKSIAASISKCWFE